MILFFGPTKKKVKCGKCGTHNYMYEYERISCKKCGSWIEGPDYKS